jgi:hypothetical protein
MFNVKMCREKIHGSGYETSFVKEVMTHYHMGEVCGIYHFEDLTMCKIIE